MHHKLTKRQLERIHALRAKRPRPSLRSIGEKVGCSHEAVRRELMASKRKGTA